MPSDPRSSDRAHRRPGRGTRPGSTDGIHPALLRMMVWWRRLTRPFAVRVLFIVVGATGMAVCMTALWWGMRQVMDVGGACADGGPYVVATPCPETAAWILPLSVPLGLVFAAMLAAGLVLLERRATPVLALGWAALFGSLGWNFLEYAFADEAGPNTDWLVTGIVFMCMAAPGLAPLVMLPRRYVEERGALALAVGCTAAGGGSGVMLGVVLLAGVG